MAAEVDGWVELADALVRSADRGTADRMAAAAPYLGLTDAERTALDAEVAGRQDPAGRYLRQLLEQAPGVAEPGPGEAPGPHDETAMERAMAAADRLEREPGVLGGGQRDAWLEVLEALPAHRAGTLVQRLVTQGGPGAMAAAVAVAGRVPMSRAPVEDLLRSASAASEDDLPALAEVLFRVPRDRLRGALALVLAQAPHASLGRLVELLADRQAGEHTVGAEPPPDPVGAEAPPAPVDGEPPPPAPTRPRDGDPVYRGSGGRATGEGEVDGESGAEGEGAGEGELTAYPRLDLVSGTARPDVVVVDRPFTVTVGLGSRSSYGIVSTGPLTLPATGSIDVVIAYDPDSLRLDGPERHTLEVTAGQPYPTVDVTVTARHLEEAPRTRRIGVHYLRGTQVVGVAWRRFVAVDEEVRVAQADAPPTAEPALLDLRPVLSEDAPDLVLAVVRADTGSDRWVWSAYAADPALPVSDAPDVATLDGEVVEFATATRRGIQFSTNAYADYLTLAGRAQRIGASVPPAVHEALAATLAAAGATGDRAPTVLLLTEELSIPWELATLSPPVETPWGGRSPFLGAHVAISRWPLTDRKPRPVPKTAVKVGAAAVVTADYTGVPGWGRLDAALAEAEEVQGLFDPPAVLVDPDLVQVIDLLRGTPPADLLHVALHGQFDQEGEQEGIVLLDRGADGTARPQFLTPVQIETGSLPAGPFVFLNACQVGSDERVLGAYGGFSSTLLRIGASGVVAPLWNIDDVIAAEVARELYAAALGPADGAGDDGLVPVAEALRRVRARYTEEAVRADAPGVRATLVAFQVFGHPRLRLRRSG